MYLQVAELYPLEARKKDLEALLNYSNLSAILKSFRKFVDENPKYYYPYEGYYKISGKDFVYDILPVYHYKRYQHLLDAGTRSITFKNEVPRLKELMELNTKEKAII